VVFQNKVDMMKRSNEALETTGFCAWVLPFGFSLLMGCSPVSQ